MDKCVFIMQRRVYGSGHSALYSEAITNNNNISNLLGTAKVAYAERNTALYIEGLVIQYTLNNYICKI